MQTDREVKHNFPTSVRGLLWRWLAAVSCELCACVVAVIY